MYIAQEMLRGTVFLGSASSSPQLRGTAFFVAHPHDYEPPLNMTYLVTAGHCVAGKTDLFMRVNDPAGERTIDVPLPDGDRWFRHPNEVLTVDIAVLPYRSPDGYLSIPTKLFFDETDFLHDDTMDHGVGIGDEVASVGLFTVHAGEKRNASFVRRGTLALVPEDPVWANNVMGRMELYLIELRSIAGMSGSPVFVPHRHDIGANGRYSLLGVGLGHFDADGGDSGPVNMGIGMVAPARLLGELLEQDELVEHRERAKSAPRP